MRPAGFGGILILAAFLRAGGEAGPLALHPENGRYFTYRSKPTVLITSGEHYGCVLNLDFDYRAYLAELKANGLNHTRVFSGTYREVAGSFGITDNPLAPAPERYACPWKRSEVEGYFDGGNKFDLEVWDEAYFGRLKDFMRRASRAGVVAEINLFCPHYEEVLWEASPMNAANNVNGIGNCPRDEVYTLRHNDLTRVQIQTARKIVRELNPFDNLYFEVCNEPYAGKVTREWEDAIIGAIVDEEKALPKKHLISLNVANHKAKVLNPNPAVAIFNFHYCVPPDVVEMNYGLNRVIGENETGFRGNDDAIYRTEGWDFILAGGGLYNNLDYSFTPRHPAGDFLEYDSPGGGSPALRRQLGILKAFIEGFDFVRMAPADRLLKGGIPAGLRARILAEPGKAYAGYIHAPPEKSEVKFERAPRNGPAGRGNGFSAKPALDLPPGKYRAQWMDPETGKVLAKEKFAHPGGIREMASPPFARDIALKVRIR